MLSNQIETAHMALTELAGEVSPAQWCLVRAIIEDLKNAADKARSIENALLCSPSQLCGQQQERSCIHG